MIEVQVTLQSSSANGLYERCYLDTHFRFGKSLALYAFTGIGVATQKYPSSIAMVHPTARLRLWSLYTCRFCVPFLWILSL